MPELDSLVAEYADPDVGAPPEAQVDAAPEPVLDPAPASPAPSPVAAVPPPAAPAGDYDITDPVLNIQKPDPNAPVAKVDDPAAPAPVTPQISPDLLQRAAYLGFTPESLAAYPNPETEILRAENIAFRAQQAVIQNQNQQRFTQQQQQQVAQPPVAPAAPDLVAYKKSLTDAGYEESLAQAHVQLKADQHGLAMQSHGLALQQFEQARWAHQMHAWAQGTQNQIQANAVAHQNELIQRDYEAFAGKQDAGVQKLLADPATRQRIMQEADIRHAGMVARGIQPPDNRTIFEQAKLTVLGDKLAASAREKVRAEVLTHQGRAISRPRGSAPNTQYNERTAGAALNAAYARLGLPAQGAAFPANEPL